MAKFATNSTLFRLIEAGHLARQALLVGLRDRGLEAGDDAILFAIRQKKGSRPETVAERTGLPPMVLATRLERLTRDGWLAQNPVGKKQRPGIHLTAAGRGLRDLLDGQWRELGDALTGDLSRSDLRVLRRTLKRFGQVLRA